MASLAFLQGGPAPPFAVPPADPELVKRIDTLASYAQRNGLSFVQMMAQRQGANPEFSFLHGGSGHEYYSWALYCALNGLNVSKPPPAAPAPRPAPAAASPAAAPPPAQAPAQPQDTAAVLQSLPQEVSSGWQQVLALLNGSRDSIRQSSDWFLACAPYAAGMAELMVQLALTTADHQKQLHLVYLANDILFKALAQRAAGTGPDADAVAQAFAPRLGRLLRAAYAGGGQGSEAQAALLRVANFWAERGVYERLTVERLTMEMIGVGAAGGGGPATAAAAPPPQPAYPPQAQPPAAAAAAAPPPQQAGGGASWDVAAAARAAAAAIAAKIGGGSAAGGQPAAQAPPPMQAPQPAQHQQPWGQQAPPPAQQQPWGQAQQAGQGWGQQPPQPQYPGQVQAPPYPAQLPGQAGAYPGPPPPSAYYPGGQPPQQAPYGAPPPGAYPPQGGWQAPHAPPQAGGPPAGFAAPPPHAQPPFPGQPGAGHPGFHPGFGAAPPPGAFPPHGAPPPQAPPPHAAPAAAPEPEEPGFDPCSFPPGLIPKLVEDHLKTDPPYSPLSPLDIEAAGVPPPPKVDPYLKSRLDKFYAQLEDYRPGMLYSDIEVDAPRSKHFSDRGGPPGGPPPMAPPGPELPHAGLGLSHAPPGFMGLDDGSYGGPGLGTGSGGSGLGFGSAKREAWEQRQREREGGAAAAASVLVPGGMLPAGDDAAGGSGGVDVFSSYRHLRSKGYHQMIVENAAKRWNPVKK